MPRGEWILAAGPQTLVRASRGGPVHAGQQKTLHGEVSALTRTESEARAWIKRAGSASQFAPTRFDSPEAALDFVYKIYRAGAVVVTVTVAEAGEALRIDLPADTELRAQVIEMCNVERERVGAATLSDDGQGDILLSWDGVPA